LQRQVLGIRGLRYLDRRAERRVVERIIMERESVTSERYEDDLRKTADQAYQSVYELSPKDVGVQEILPLYLYPAGYLGWDQNTPSGRTSPRV
jgi:hypothetical protein